MMSQLRLSEFPPGLLMPNYSNNHADNSKLNLTAYIIRCTLSSTSGMHLHKMEYIRKINIWVSCERNYFKLVAVMENNHSEAAVVKYLYNTRLSQLAAMTAEKVFRMAQKTRKIIVTPRRSPRHTTWCRR